MSIKNTIDQFTNSLKNTNNKSPILVIVTKTKPISLLQEVYDLGYRIFGENKVQELVEKHEALPQDIEWHLIGHLQTNKVKYIASFVSFIHAVDSWKLLVEIDKQAKKCNRTINCLLQIHIAQEDTKFGLNYEEATTIALSPELVSLKNIKICGLMGIATFTEDEAQIRKEFHLLHEFFEKMKAQLANKPYISMQELSIGMSHDYLIALEEGSTMIRIGSAILGERG